MRRNYSSNIFTVSKSSKWAAHQNYRSVNTRTAQDCTTVADRTEQNRTEQIKLWNNCFLLDDTRAIRLLYALFLVDIQFKQNKNMVQTSRGKP